MKFVGLTHISIIALVTVFFSISPFFGKTSFVQYLCDIDRESQEGLAEAIHALQVVSGFFPDENTNQVCDDGLDSDNDGFTDCDDFDCAGTTPCP